MTAEEEETKKNIHVNVKASQASRRLPDRSESAMPERSIRRTTTTDARSKSSSGRNALKRCHTSSGEGKAGKALRKKKKKGTRMAITVRKNELTVDELERAASNSNSRSNRK
jgi:hypothetical protein